MVEQHLRLRNVIELTGLSRSTIYELIRQGRFPHSIKLSKRAVAWPESSISEWLAERLEMTRSRSQLSNL